MIFLSVLGIRGLRPSKSRVVELQNEYIVVEL